MGAQRRAGRVQAAFGGVLVLLSLVAVQPAAAVKPPASSHVPDHVTLPDLPPQVPDLPAVHVPPGLDPTGVVQDVADTATGGGDPEPAAPPPAPDPPPAAPPPSGGDGGAPPVDQAPAPQVPAGGGDVTPGSAAAAPPAAAVAAAAGAAPDPAPEFTATDREPVERAEFEASAAQDDGGSLSGRLGNVIAALPTGILIGILAMAALALLMTGRSAWFARATDRLKLQSSELREEVGVLQSALVPDIPAEIAGAAVAVAYRPAAGPASGGDFHDVFELDDGRLGIVVGDVSGHGPEALPSTPITHFTIRAYLEAGLEPRAALRLADRALSGSMDGHFATAIAGVYDPETDQLTYASAGHPAPLIIAGHEHRSIDALSAPPIGLGPAAGSRQTTCTVGPGGSVWFFTDGLIEVRGDDGTMLGRDGLEAMLAEAPEPRELLKRLAADEAPGDDMTACNVAPGGAFAEPTMIEEVEIGRDVDPETVREFAVASGVTDAEAERIVTRCKHMATGTSRATILRIERHGADVEWRMRTELEPTRGRRGRPRRALGEAVRI